MRITLECNSAGDIRLRMLRDTKDASKISAPNGAALVCSSELRELTTKSHKELKTGYGGLSRGTTFGRAARRLVREAGAVLDSHPKENLIFLTGTLPGSTPEALEALARWSGWVAAGVQNWIRDFAPGSLAFGVWEYQRRGALHLHLCVATQSRAQAALLKRRWKERWIKFLLAVTRRSNTDVFQRDGNHSWLKTPWVTRTDAQSVEKSVGCYLAKYLSKGSTAAMKSALYPPSRWWFCSSALREKISEARLTASICKLPALLAQDIFDRVAGALCSDIPRAYFYQSPCDAVVKGLICLGKPIQSSLIYDIILLNFRCLESGIKTRFGDRAAKIGDVLNCFSGRLLVPI